MIKRLLIGTGVVLVVGVAGFFILSTQKKAPENQSNQPANGTENQALKPTIEITTPAAYLVSATGEKTELKDGDAITPPATIEVSDAGAANINFPDGSTARIRYGTKFTLTKADYDATTGKANTGFFLSVGRIWSKVIELATPDSSWEVKTSNAVATVRGTAFDSEASATSTTFIGSEHEVDVKPLDPDTNERMDDKGLGLGEGKVVRIGAKILADILAGKGRLATSTLPDGEKNTNWHQGNERMDGHVNGYLKEMRDRGLKGKDLQKEMRDKVRKEIRDRILEDLKDGTIHPATEQFLNYLTGSTSTSRATSTRPAASSTTQTIKTISLDVVPVVSLAGIVEHTPVKFKAIAKLLDGTTVDVTAKANWKVLGQIGKFTAPGTLYPELDPLIAETGAGSGAVVATFFDPIGGSTFLGKTAIFGVAADIGPISTSTNTGA